MQVDEAAFITLLDWSPIEHSHLPTPEEVFRSKVLSDQSTIATVRLVDGRTVAKYGRKVFVQEANAMILAASIGVPVPEVYGAYRYNEQTFIFMAFVPGETLELAWDGMTAEQKDRLILDLRETHASLRKLTSTYVGGLNKAPITYLANYGNAGPYSTVEDFNNAIMSAIEIDNGQDPFFRASRRRLIACSEDKLPVFSYENFQRQHIIMQGGRLSAVVGWRKAGFMPVRWEWVFKLPHQKHILLFGIQSWKSYYSHLIWNCLSIVNLPLH
ncbi:hypothetical protein BT69DRAFT_1255491 [Atractiella rhizophila]|nr:hypothetical protein BT69DRAFT_1255491 [Atractiella rhizophila]